MAGQELGDSAPQLLGQALRMVLHHRLVLSSDNTGWQRGEFFADSLVSDSDVHPVANAIKNERYAQLNQVKAFQHSVLAHALRLLDATGPVVSGGMMYVLAGYSGATGAIGYPTNVLLAFSVDGK